jgi:hypothetical protein
MKTFTALVLAFVLLGCRSERPPAYPGLKCESFKADIPPPVPLDRADAQNLFPPGTAKPVAFVFIGGKSFHAYGVDPGKGLIVWHVEGAAADAAAFIGKLAGPSVLILGASGGEVMAGQIGGPGPAGPPGPPGIPPLYASELINYARILRTGTALGGCQAGGMPYGG